MVKQEYLNLQKKFDLPKYQQINQDFELSNIEDTDFLLRDIRRKITEKLSFYTKIIEDLMQPDGSFSSLHECRALNEEEKDNIFNLYSELMMIDRDSVILSLQADDTKDAEFINISYKKWQEMKPKLLSLLKKIRLTWDEKTEPGEKVRYFG